MFAGMIGSNLSTKKQRKLLQTSSKSYLCLVALRQLRDKVVGVGCIGCGDDLLLRGVLLTEQYVLPYQGRTYY